ncbi:MAG: hypothetical protein JWQ28_1867 [Pedobacter sp.]|nr:hypothetical protein [Pedobacter sp.]
MTLSKALHESMLGKLKSIFRSSNDGLILMYHRIHDADADPWQLSVSPENFEQQLQVLTRYYNVLPIVTFLEHRQANVLKRNSVCLTFDDGYADNYDNARPLLLKYNVPATFFISSAFINTDELFWWDELATLILQTPRLPLKVTLKLPDENFTFIINQDVLTEEGRAKIRHWHYPQAPPTQRCDLYLAIWERLQRLSLSEIQLVIQQLRVMTASVAPSKDWASYPMTSLQLDSLFNSPLFSAGIHTATHPALALQSPKTQTAELLECASYLKRYGSERPLPIAYPYGSYNEDTLSIVAQMNVPAGFTTNPSVVNAGSNPLTLGRFQVENWGGQSFRKQLKEWRSTR